MAAAAARHSPGERHSDATPQTFDVTLVSDGTAESDETVNLTLGNATSAALGTQATSTLTITESAGFIQFNQATFGVFEDEGLVVIEAIRYGGSTGR